MLKVAHEENESQQHVPAAVGGSLLDELARSGARQMLATALLTEVAMLNTAASLRVRSSWDVETTSTVVALRTLARRAHAMLKEADEVSGDGRVRCAPGHAPALAGEPARLMAVADQALDVVGGRLWSGFYLQAETPTTP